MIIRPGFMECEFLGIILNDPSMVIGTIGRLKSVAKTNAPRLNRLILPSSLLEPSGNITSDIPFANLSRAVCIVRSMADDDERSTNICPAAMQARPTNGMFLRLFFIIHLKLWLRYP